MIAFRKFIKISCLTVLKLYIISYTNLSCSKFIHKSLTNLDYTEDCQFTYSTIFVISGKDCTKFLASKNLDDWLFKILKLWTHENPNFEVIVFFWQFIGILVSNEEGFTFLEERSVLDALIRISSLHIFAQNSLKLAFVKCLSKLLKYNSGYLWVIKTKKWKMVVRIICFKNNFYVQQEGYYYVINY